MIDMILLRGKQGLGIVVNRHRSDFIPNSVCLAAALTGVDLADDFFNHVESVGNLSEHRMAVVEERCRCGGDEKLRSIGSGTRVGHREHPWSTMAQVGVEFIGETIARTSSAAFRRVTALDHESFDYPVEGDVVVVTPRREVEEIRTGQRGLRRIQRGLDVACGGVHGDFDVGDCGHAGRQQRNAILGNPDFLGRMLQFPPVCSGMCCVPRPQRPCPLGFR